MKVPFRVLVAAGCFALLSLSCGFAPNPSHSLDEDIIVTAAPVYQPIAAVYGGERFPSGARLLLIHEGKASPLVPQFAASADASVSFDGSSILFSGKKNGDDPWQIWEMKLSDRTVRQVVNSGVDAIRPLYLPGWRLVYAQKAAERFQMVSARLIDSKELAEMEGPGAKPVFPLTYTNASAIPDDVLADGRILFEAGFPLGDGTTPELFAVYSDGSGIESYRCDHPTTSTDARWGGHQLKSGDVVFTHSGSLARFTSSVAHEVKVTLLSSGYSGGISETNSGELILSSADAASGHDAVKLRNPGAAAMRTVLATKGESLVEPVVVSPRIRPRRHPSALHDWDYGNLLALDSRISRDGAMKSTAASVRLEAQDNSGHAVTMGTAAVESDGSFFVKAPADRAIRLALLDAKGGVIRQEHGWFWIRRGEQRYCVGCHAGPEHAPENRVPQALMNGTTPVDLTGTRSQPERGGN